MAKFAPHTGDPHGDPQTSPQHANPHGFVVWVSLGGAPKSMWIGVLWAALRVAMWVTHVGGEFRHALSSRKKVCVQFLFPNFLTFPRGTNFPAPNFLGAVIQSPKKGNLPPLRASSKPKDPALQKNYDD